MADCEKYIEMMSAMVDGELTKADEAELRSHLDDCADCRRVYSAFSGISGALSEELATPPETLVKGVMYKINLQKKGGRRFAFGRFTALAACLVLVLFGASYLGLFDGSSPNKTESVAAPKAASGDATADNQTLRSSSDAADENLGTAGGAETGEPEQSVLTAGATEECTDGTVLQFGFASESLIAPNDSGTEEEKEPEFLFEAKKMSVYEGKYYPEEENADKNKLLFTLETEEDLKAVYELITAMPDNSVEYTPKDGEILKSDPLYTLFVPADTEKDKDAKDKIICIWFVDGEVWCVISDALPPDPALNTANEKILYKAEGVQEKFETAISDMKRVKGIT